MSANLQSALIAGIILLIVSCHKTSDKPPARNPGDSTGTTAPGSGTTSAKTTDIYVCGSDNGKPCYWKNDTEVVLPITGATQGGGLSMVVHGTDVYVAGYAIGANGYCSPVYWKNGTPTGLYPRTTAGVPAGGAYLCPSITFADSNVYVAIDQRVDFTIDAKSDSYEKIQPSGVTTQYGVSDLLNGATINSIFVSGADVYCAGSGYQGVGIENNLNVIYPFASYFQNGAETFLPPAQDLYAVEDYVYGQATGIAVSGSDIYVVGWQAPGWNNDGSNDSYSTSVLWKNNVPQKLKWTGGYDAGGSPTSILVADTNVYISGTVTNEAVYWKNGVITICDNSNSTGSTSSAASVGAAPNGDVYVAGNDGTTGALWKNGTRQLLGTPGNSIASGVFVYTH